MSPYMNCLFVATSILLRCDLFLNITDSKAKNSKLTVFSPCFW